MSQPYSYFDILEARVRALIALGFTAKEAAQIVAETYKPRPVRQPAA